MKAMRLKLFVLVRRLVYLVLGQIDAWLGKEALVVVYCYHSVSDDGWYHSVPREKFRRQIEYLRSRYKPISMRDLYLYLQGKKEINEPSFVLTFDDGYADLWQVREFLRKVKLKPIVFAVGQGRKVDRKALGTKKRLLGAERLKLLSKEGWDVGCHSNTHRVLTDLNEEERREELAGAKKKLEKLLGKKVRFFAYPKGRYDKGLMRLAKESGYWLACGMNGGEVKRSVDCWSVPRVGVNGTHSMCEFTMLQRPSVLCVRRILSKICL